MITVRGAVSPFAVLSVVIALAALFSWANHRFIGLPTTIGVTFIALAISLALIGADALGWPLRGFAASVVARLDFRGVVLDWMLAVLLFAGALNVDLEELKGQRFSVAVLATGGVLVST